MNGLGWLSIVRLGLVQASLGGVVVLTTSTLNRVMVLEYALPALVPGVLVALHYLVQVLRPRMGHGTDVGGRSTPWILGGMAVLALGGVLAAAATGLMGENKGAGLLLAVVAFVLVGVGVSAAGTALLVLLAKRVAPARRAAAATTVWLMMIAGFAVTASVAGAWLDPYSPARLLAVCAVVSVVALLVAAVAVRGVEGTANDPMRAEPRRASGQPSFRAVLDLVWHEPVARHFTIFVFVSMLAYSAQDLILEPFAGRVFGLSPGATTRLAGLQHGGVLLGMLVVALVRQDRNLRRWTIAGCIASAFALLCLAAAGLHASGWPLQANVFLLGVANGVFCIGAISSMMRLADQGRPASQGVRMGLWGAAQAVAFALGGLLGTGASDVASGLMASPGAAYAAVFALEAAGFAVAAALAWRLGARAAAPPSIPVVLTQHAA